MNTRGKILDKALQMFNERGIEYVGLRELAKILDMRVSNITYYFPTKDDLVFQLSLELNKLNSEVMQVHEFPDTTKFLEMMRKVFQHHQQFRCLLLSFVHLMSQNKLIAAQYKKTQATRMSTISLYLQELTKAGYLKGANAEVNHFLVSSISLISRFWISEAAISQRQLHVVEQADHYLKIIAQLLVPYSSAKAKKEIEAFFKTLS